MKWESANRKEITSTLLVVVPIVVLGPLHKRQAAKINACHQKVRRNIKIIEFWGLSENFKRCMCENAEHLFNLCEIYFHCFRKGCSHIKHFILVVIFVTPNNKYYMYNFRTNRWPDMAVWRQCKGKTGTRRNGSFALSTCFRACSRLTVQICWHHTNNTLSCGLCCACRHIVYDVRTVHTVHIRDITLYSLVRYHSTSNRRI